MPKLRRAKRWGRGVGQTAKENFQRHQEFLRDQTQKGYNDPNMNREALQARNQKYQEEKFAAEDKAARIAHRERIQTDPEFREKLRQQGLYRILDYHGQDLNSPHIQQLMNQEASPKQETNKTPASK